MYPFPQSANPAARSHFNAQLAFFNGLSQSLARSFQDVCQLNMQLGQTMLEETTLASQRLMTADRPAEALSAAASRTQPATEKLRAYQQHLSRIAAATQVDLSRIAEQHVQETSRTARALADEVTRAVSEETDRNMRQQEEVLKNFRDPFKQDDTRETRTTMQAPGNLQSSSAGSSGGTAGAPMQAGATMQASASMQADGKAGNKNLSRPG